MTPHHVLRCLYYRDMAAAELDSADPSTTRGKWLRARVIQKAQRQQELKLKARNVKSDVPLRQESCDKRRRWRWVPSCDWRPGNPRSPWFRPHRSPHRHKSSGSTGSHQSQGPHTQRLILVRTCNRGNMLPITTQRVGRCTQEQAQLGRQVPLVAPTLAPNQIRVQSSRSKLLPRLRLPLENKEEGCCVYAYWRCVGVACLDSTDSVCMLASMRFTLPSRLGCSIYAGNSCAYSL